jgi:ribose-phosphate pyrophosphokinase
MLAHNPEFMVFTGNANPSMAQEIAHNLDITLGAAHVGRFSDGEVTVEIHQNVRAREVFVVQSTCAPTNDNLMELLIMVDALKRASAERISAVIPYFGYARQDRRQSGGQYAANRWRVARADHGLACRPDSGLF